MKVKQKKCECCKGTGYVSIYDAFGNMGFRECPICKETGKLDEGKDLIEHAIDEIVELKTENERLVDENNKQLDILAQQKDYIEALEDDLVTAKAIIKELLHPQKELSHSTFIKDYAEVFIK